MVEVQDQQVHIEPTRAAMGALAARQVAAYLREVLSQKHAARMIFAAAPSQSEMLAALVEEKDIDWARVEAFHMDEYIGLPPEAPQNFRNWLKSAFFDRVPLGHVHLIEPAADAEACAAGYAELLAAHPIDIVCMGIGMNGHIAFNDPSTTFDDPLDVKIVVLQEESRQQQVFDGLFPVLDAVPERAISLTIPRLLRADRLFCCVPGKLKEPAVTRALRGPITPDSPASILRTHKGCSIYLDAESSAGLSGSDGYAQAGSR
ncbi:MAG: 6-phosphogluconolactonase [Edaphobacter sp.]|uniref:6-phosphogluconolactonase n=1 Tax=Edaphobacter sp. TaxID=1934404 RepID=UPI00238C9FAF|nr:6-phosphogluconolactonase [Edaphobacter sp.]MDE1177920.1 6-phosphogluconolactonase [Edaphobacter sp.]